MLVLYLYSIIFLFGLSKVFIYENRYVDVVFKLWNIFINLIVNWLINLRFSILLR